MIAIYGYNELNQWVVVDLVTLDEYLNMPSTTQGEYITVTKI